MKSKELIKIIKNNFNRNEIIEEIKKCLTEDMPVNNVYKSWFIDSQDNMVEGQVVDYKNGALLVDIDGPKWSIKLENMSNDELLLLALVVVK
jgi:hypothetical protein